MESRRLYCHYFHTTSSCKKEAKCSFLHGEKLESCPNLARCPIRVPHIEVNLPISEDASTKIPKKEKQKKKESVKEAPEINVPKPFVTKPVLYPSEIQSFSKISSNKVAVTLSSWDNDIIAVEFKMPAATLVKNEKKQTQKTDAPVTKAVPITKAHPVTVENNSSSFLPSATSASGSYQIPAEADLQDIKLSTEIKTFIEKHYNKASAEERTFLSNFLPLQQDMQRFLPIYRSMFPQTKLDLMFLVDCTGSMSSWIEAVKLEISGIVAAIRNSHPGCVIRLSFIGYRDFCDTVRFEVFRFSTNLEEFTKFVSKIQATGGGDAAEDVAGGFLNANLQSWESHAKYAVLLADAPAHGRKYHKETESWYDNYLNGDPDNSDLEQQFKSLIRKGVQLYAVEIMKCTQIMFEQFSKFNAQVNGQDLNIMSLGHSTSGFGQYISQTASQTLSQSYTKQSKEDPQSMFFKALQIIKGQQTEESSIFMDRYTYKGKQDDDSEEEEEEKKENTKTKSAYDKITLKIQKLPSKLENALKDVGEFQAICHTYFIVHDKGVPINWRKPLVQNSSIKTKIVISKTPFAEGAMRYAFFAKDTLLNQNLVAKINKKQYPETWDALQSKNKEDMVRDLESQFICQHIVNEFNNRITEHVKTTANLKNFVHCFIYEMTNKTAPYRFYSAENYIAGEYVKFNNNAGWSNMTYDEPGLLSQALSHFSYQLTEGYLMIVDLQGVGSLLTDPQIHCQDRNRFGAGNLGYQGMFKFFVSHECNKYCHSLHLNHPSVSSMPTTLPFFNKALEMPSDFEKKVFCMCDLCKKPFETIAAYVYSKNKQAQEKYCPSCDQKKSASMKKANCTKCKAPFRSSTYWFLMKRTDFPELCGQCRRDRRDHMRSMIQG